MSAKELIIRVRAGSLFLIKRAALHAGVFVILLVVAIAGHRSGLWSTTVIRNIPLLYFFYIGMVLIISAVAGRGHKDTAK